MLKDNSIKKSGLKRDNIGIESIKSCLRCLMVLISGKSLVILELKRNQVLVFRGKWEVVENDGTVNHNKNDILNRWNSDFEQLLNQQLVPDMSDSANLLNISQCTADLTPLGSVITIDEVQGALNRSKNGKSMGDDGIPVEVLRND